MTVSMRENWFELRPIRFRRKTDPKQKSGPDG